MRWAIRVYLIAMPILFLGRRASLCVYWRRAKRLPAQVSPNLSAAGSHPNLDRTGLDQWLSDLFWAKLLNDPRVLTNL